MTPYLANKLQTMGGADLVPREQPYQTAIHCQRSQLRHRFSGLPLRFSLSGQRSYAIRCARGGGGAWERG